MAGKYTDTLKIGAEIDVGDFLRGSRKVISATRSMNEKFEESAKITMNVKGGIKEVTVGLDENGKSVVKSTKKLKDYNKTLLGTGDNLGTILAKVTQWTLATGIIFGVVRGFRDLGGTIVEVDDKMVMLKKVFQGTRESLQGVKDDAIDLSIEMGNLIAPSIDAATVWARMGRRGSELSEALRVSLLAQNIAEIDASDGAKLLNAALIQFNKTIDQGIVVLDEWNELSNRTPVTTRDLADAVSQAGAIFKVAGAQIEDVNAYTVALSASMAKSGREIGNALKTIGSYVKRTETIPKIAKIAGIEVQREGEAFLSLDQIIMRLAGTWSTLTDVQREEIASTSAGVKRKAFFLSLMENFNLVIDAYRVQWESAGSAVRENEIRLDSLKTKMTQVKAVFQKFSVQTGDGGLLGILKKLADGLTNMSESFNDLSGTSQLATGTLLMFGMTLASTTVNTLAATAARKDLTIQTALLQKVSRGGLWLGGVTATITASVMLIKYLNRENDLIREANKLRQEGMQGLNAKAADAKSIREQEELLGQLVAAYDDRIAKGLETAGVEKMIRQTLEAIRDTHPEMLVGAEGFKEVYDNLSTELDLIPGKLRKIQEEQDKLAREDKVATAVAESPFIETVKEQMSTRGAFFEGAEAGDPTLAITARLNKSKGQIEEALLGAAQGEIDLAWDGIIKYAQALGAKDATREMLAGMLGLLSEDDALAPGGMIGPPVGGGFTLGDMSVETTKQMFDLIKELESINVTVPSIDDMFKKDGKTPAAFNVDMYDDAIDQTKKLGKAWDRAAISWGKLTDKQLTSDEFRETMKLPGGTETMDDVADKANRASEFVAKAKSELESLAKATKTDAVTQRMEILNEKIGEYTDRIKELTKLYGKLATEEKAAERRADALTNRYKRLIEQYSRVTTSAKEYAEASGLGGVFDDGTMESALVNLEAMASEYEILARQSEESAVVYEHIITLWGKINKEIKKTEAESRKLQRAQERLAKKLGDDIGEYIGSGIAAGFGSDEAHDAGRNFVEGVGSFLGDTLATKVSASVGSSLGASLGAAAGPAGVLVGATAGGIVSSMFSVLAEGIFGEDETPVETLADEVERNTVALQENTDAFNDFQERLINAPSTFSLPALKGDIPEYDTGGTVLRSGLAKVDAGEYIGSEQQLADYFSSKLGYGYSDNSQQSIMTIEAGAIQILGSDGNSSEIADAVMNKIDERFYDKNQRGSNLRQDF